jgi:hypothetical protein
MTFKTPRPLRILSAASAVKPRSAAGAHFLADENFLNGALFLADPADLRRFNSFVTSIDGGVLLTEMVNRMQ